MVIIRHSYFLCTPRRAYYLFVFKFVIIIFKEFWGKDINTIELKKTLTFHAKCMQFKEMFDISVVLVTNKLGQRQ